MSVDFRPGDWVEKYRDLPLPNYPGSPLPNLPIGCVRQVARVAVDLDGDTLLDLVENHHPQWGYLADEWRVIYRPDPKLIERLLAEPVFAAPVRAPDREEVAAPSGLSRPSPTSRPLMARELFAAGDCSR